MAASNLQEHLCSAFELHSPILLTDHLSVEIIVLAYTHHLVISVRGAVKMALDMRNVATSTASP